MVAGITLRIGEDVAEFQTSTQQRLIGTEPCRCGRLWCSNCPIFEKVETKTPIFKRHKLTLKNQINLHRWMVKQAVDRVSSLVDTRGELRGHMLDKPKSGELASIAWKSPHQNVFYGRDDAVEGENAHQD